MIAMGRPGRTWCVSNFFTAPYAVSPPHASGASSIADAVGELHQRPCPHAEVLGERAHDRLVLAAEAAAGPGGSTRHAPHQYPPPALRGRGSRGRRPTRKRRHRGRALRRCRWPRVRARHWRRARPVATGDVQVGVAHASCSDVDQRLLLARDGNVHVADVQDAVFEPCCLHRFPHGRGVSGSCHELPPRDVGREGRAWSRLFEIRGEWLSAGLGHDLAADLSPEDHRARRHRRVEILGFDRSVRGAAVLDVGHRHPC